MRETERDGEKTESRSERRRDLELLLGGLRAGRPGRRAAWQSRARGTRGSGELRPVFLARAAAEANVLGEAGDEGGALWGVFVGGADSVVDEVGEEEEGEG